MLIEALVLRRHERLLHLLRNVGEHHPDPPLVLLEYLGKALPPPVQHHACAGKLEALELAVIGQVGERLVVEVDHLGEVDRWGRHLLVLAELPIRGQQIGKIDAAERLALAHRLGVVHGGRDELVEVDILDVEGLAHMRAARTQQRRHLGLVRLPLEPGGNRLRRRRHLTKRKRSRKDLDEQRFHGPSRETRMKGAASPH